MIHQLEQLELLTASGGSGCCALYQLADAGFLQPSCNPGLHYLNWPGISQEFCDKICNFNLLAGYGKCCRAVFSPKSCPMPKEDGSLDHIEL